MLPNKQRLRLKKITVNTCHLMPLIADTGIHHKSDHNSGFIAQLVTRIKNINGASFGEYITQLFILSQTLSLKYGSRREPNEW